MTFGISRTIPAETDLIVPDGILKNSASLSGARRARPDSACLAFLASLACLAGRPCGEPHWVELSDELTKAFR
jgi:hypothetical protein